MPRANPGLRGATPLVLGNGTRLIGCFQAHSFADCVGEFGATAFRVMEIFLVTRGRRSCLAPTPGCGAQHRWCWGNRRGSLGRWRISDGCIRFCFRRAISGNPPGLETLRMVLGECGEVTGRDRTRLNLAPGRAMGRLLSEAPARLRWELRRAGRLPPSLESYGGQGSRNSEPGAPVPPNARRRPGRRGG